MIFFVRSHPLIAITFANWPYADQVFKIDTHLSCKFQQKYNMRTVNTSKFGGTLYLDVNVTIELFVCFVV